MEKAQLNRCDLSARLKAAWITVDITKRNRKTIPHIRTANRKCTLLKLSSCASYTAADLVVEDRR